MDVVRLGKKGQLSLPRTILKRLGLTGQELLLVDIAPDGSIVLRPAGVYPLEIYSDRRVAEFLDEDRLSPREARRLRRTRRRPKS